MDLRILCCGAGLCLAELAPEGGPLYSKQPKKNRLSYEMIKSSVKALMKQHLQHFCNINDECFTIRSGRFELQKPVAINAVLLYHIHACDLTCTKIDIN